MWLCVLGTSVACSGFLDSRDQKEFSRLYRASVYREAIPFGERVFERAENAGDVRVIVETGTELAEAKRLAGDTKGAGALADELLQLAERELPEDPLLADVLFQAATVRSVQSDLDGAVALFERALRVREKTQGPDHPRLSMELAGLAHAYEARSDYPKAQSYIERATALRIKGFGEDSIEVARSRSSLGEILRKQGKYEEARRLQLQALDVFIARRGENHRGTAGILNSLGSIEMEQGNYAEAERYFERTQKALLATLGPDHANVGVVQQNLAAIYNYQGKLEKALKAQTAALAILEKTLGSEDSTVGVALINRGMIEENAGNPAEAERSFKAALKILESRFGAEHEYTATALSNLADLYRNQNMAAPSADLQRRVLAVLERLLGPEHYRVGYTLVSLGSSLLELGELDEAEALFGRARQIWTDALGPNHHLVGEAAIRAAEVELARGRHLQAVKLFRQGVEIGEGALGRESPLVASWSIQLAEAEERAGRPEQAEQQLRAALRIADKVALRYGDRMLAELRLARLAWRRGDSVEALRRFEQAASRGDEDLGNLLDGLPEARRRELLRTNSELMDTVISFQLISARSEEAARVAYQAILTRKGRGLEVAARQLAEYRGTLDAEARGLLDQLRHVDRSISALAYEREEEKPGAHAGRMEVLRGERARIEGALLDRSALSRPLPVSLANVAARLPAGTALVDYVRFHKVAPGARRARAIASYAAYVILPSGEIRWRDLGPAEPVDRAVAGLRDALSRPGDPGLRKHARELDRKVLAPIVPLLGNTREILLSPDGALSVTPFAPLIGPDGRFRVESLTVSYLDSPRDLVRLVSVPHSRERALVLGAPDFAASVGRDPAADVAASGAPIDALLLRSTRSRDFRLGRFEPLPGAVAELTDVARLLGVEPFLGRAAAEDTLKAVRSPRVVHVATHAFFLEDLASVSRRARAATWEDPLLRGGLVLAGAGAPRNEQQREDGVLTALEASNLDLAGTELLVLSACETGLGEVRNADGVYGLRRAFALAGVRSQLMTLWKVNDDATQRLMAGFYPRILSGEGRARALREVQLQMLRDPVLGSPYFWAGFFLSGDWMPLPA
jgi:CHAT domain-containing protein/tetratricopeptide (TPR) repeat protein